MSPSEQVNRIVLVVLALAMWGNGVIAIKNGGFYDPVLRHYFDYGKFSLLVGVIFFAVGGWAFVLGIRRRRSGTDREE